VVEVASYTPPVLVLCLACLLLGSLLRSLLSETDFVILSDTAGEWRELKRLAQLRLGGWSLVIGFARL
jgi:hypothetical protein